MQLAIVLVAYFIMAAITARVIFKIAFHMTIKKIDPDSRIWDEKMDEIKSMSILFGLVWHFTLICGIVYGSYKLAYYWLGGGAEQKYVNRWEGKQENISYWNDKLHSKVPAERELARATLDAIGNK